MTCTCGNYVASNARFCPRCGKRFTHRFVKLLSWFFAIIIGIGIILAVVNQSNTANAPSQAERQKKAKASTPSAPVPVITYIDPKLWFIRPTASRTQDGGIVVSATTNIPDGVNLWVQLANGASSKVKVVGGKFTSEAFTNREKPIPPGSHQVAFTAYFNNAWEQPAAVLKLTGEEGTKLHGPLFHKTDPDAIDSPVVLDYKPQIQFPPMTRELEAISLVQGAVLTVDGRRSSATVGETVKWFLQPSTGIRMGKGWSATKTAAETYTVQLDIVDSANDGPAIWQANLQSRKVRFVNMAAKSMSYLPPD